VHLAIKQTRIGFAKVYAVITVFMSPSTTGGGDIKTVITA